jgi:hypothetical protein
MDTFKPSEKYPPLTNDRLVAVANIIRRVRHEAAVLHDPLAGDNGWSLGCRAYARTCYALTQATKGLEWLSILPEAEALRFSFAIAGIPFRFYKGFPDDPPTRYLSTTYAELHQHQLALEITGFVTVDGVLRLAVETDVAGDASAITLVEVDEAGEVTNTYQIPEMESGSNVTVIKTPAIDLPPVVIEPVEQPSENSVKKKAKKRDTGA